MALTGMIDIIKWVGKNIWVLVVGAFGILLALLRMERKKVEKLEVKIVEQDKEIIHHQKQVEVLEVAQQAVVEVVEKMTEISQEQQVEEEKIEEAKTDEEIIAIANDIVSRFNSR